MAQIVEIECNGPNKHINEVDLHELLKPIPIARSGSMPINLPDETPDRFVLKCKLCTEGRVNITREMLLEMLNDKPN